MPMPSITPERAFNTVFNRGVKTGFGVLLLGGILVAVAVSPTALHLLDRVEQDWSRLGDIGQAYGPVSALLSAVALCVVVFVQRGQWRHERLWTVRGMHMDVLNVALDDPAYAQCWGTRMAPEGVDERLFYYINSIIMLWSYAWENGELRDGHVRSYARTMFDSEAPRLYWRMYGGWRVSSSRGRRRRFLMLIDTEFRAAERNGPPARRIESQPAVRSGAPRRAARRGAVPVQLRRASDRTMPRKARH